MNDFLWCFRFIFLFLPMVQHFIGPICTYGVPKSTPDNPFAHLGKIATLTFWYLLGNVCLNLFNRYVCTGEHFSWDLNICWIDFMFVKPRASDVLLERANWHQTFYNAYPLETVAVIINFMSVHVKAKHRRHMAGFPKHKKPRNMSISDNKCSPVHTYRCVSKIDIFHVNIWRWALYFNGLPGVKCMDIVSVFCFPVVTA